MSATHVRSPLSGHVRALVRAARLSASTLGHFVRLSCGLLLARVGRWPEKRTAAWRTRCTGEWAADVVRIVGMRVSKCGAPPPGASLIVSNHLSYMDIVVIASACPGAFVAKSEVARWPVIGRLAKSAGTLFVERSRARGLPAAVNEMSATLGSGRNVILFPEGTSSRGDRVLPFRSPLLEVAARGQIPVTCASLSYSTTMPDPPADLAVCWWGDMRLVGHLYGLLRLSGFDARLQISSRSIADTDRKRLAARLHSAVCGLLAVSGEGRSECLAQTF